MHSIHSKKPWSTVGKREVEDVIVEKLECACWYAYNVLNDRWANVGRKDIEDLIKKNNYYWQRYNGMYSIEKIH